jgi:predicted metallopeptidase
MSSSQTGPATARARIPAGFDFTRHMRRLCEDMVRRHPRLRHIDLSRVAVGFSQARKKTRHGLYATLTPLRFPGGSTSVVRRGGTWAVQRLVDHSGREMLYILSFYLPRFLDLPLRDKLTTAVHELWHISPRCDGDLRRFRGRCYAHSGSQEQYEATVSRITDDWLALDPPPSVYAFLRSDFRQLVDRFGSIHGAKIPAPRLFRIDR